MKKTNRPWFLVRWFDGGAAYTVACWGLPRELWDEKSDRRVGPIVFRSRSAAQEYADTVADPCRELGMEGPWEPVRLNLQQTMALYGHGKRWWRSLGDGTFALVEKKDGSDGV